MKTTQPSKAQSISQPNQEGGHHVSKAISSDSTPSPSQSISDCGVASSGGGCVVVVGGRRRGAKIRGAASSSPMTSRIDNHGTVYRYVGMYDVRPVRPVVKQNQADRQAYQNKFKFDLCR